VISSMTAFPAYWTKHFRPPWRGTNSALVRLRLALYTLPVATHGRAFVVLPYPVPTPSPQQPLRLFPAHALRSLELFPQALPPEVDRSGWWSLADLLPDYPCSASLKPTPTALPARAFHARSPENGWLLDSGASTLITSRESDMFAMTLAKIPISALASTESASAQGTVRLQFAPGKNINMPALLVKNASTNLVPFSPFVDAGYSILTNKKGALIFDEVPGKILTHAPADKSGMYWLSADAVPLSGHSARTARPTALPLHATTHEVWHARLNHPSS